MGRFTNRMEIHYVTEYTQSRGMKIPHFATVTVSTTGVKRYPNTAFKFIKLSTIEIILLEYLAETMDANNLVTNNHPKRLEFLDHVKKNCGVDYSEEVVKDGFKKLKKHGFLISLLYRGYYRVNPRHYYKGLEKDRAKLLKETYSQVSTSFQHKNDVVAVIGYNSLIADRIRKEQVIGKRAAHRIEIAKIKAEIAEEAKRGWGTPKPKKSRSK